MPPFRILPNTSHAHACETLSNIYPLLSMWACVCINNTNIYHTTSSQLPSAERYGKTYNQINFDMEIQYFRSPLLDGKYKELDLLIGVAFISQQ